MRAPIGFTLCAMLAAGLLAATPARARAQDGTVRGVVKDSAGIAIADADVSIVALHQLTRTDAKGGFLFTKLPRGQHELSIRHLGYTPEKVTVTVDDMAYSYDVTLAAHATTIAGVEVSAAESRLRLDIEGFYRRRTRGMGGSFVTREEIEARHAREPTDMIRGMPGIRVTNRGVRFQGGGARNCTPTVWLDGQEVHSMEINDIPIGDIEGMELYTGPATTPAQFSQKSSKDPCGTIVVWTRIPGKA